MGKRVKPKGRVVQIMYSESTDQKPMMPDSYPPIFVTKRSPDEELVNARLSELLGTTPSEERKANDSLSHH